MFFYLLFLIFGFYCGRPYPIPVPLEILAPKNNTVLRTKLVVFSWAGRDEFISYHYQIDTSHTFKKPLFDIIGITQETDTLELSADGTYFWRVRGLSKDSVYSQWSEVARFKIERFPIIARLKTTGYPQDIFIDESFAYIADGQAGLSIIDIDEPDNPILVANIMDTLNSAYGVIVKDTLCFLAYGKKELSIINTSDIESIFEIGALEYPSPALGLEIDLKGRDTVCIAAREQFILVDATNPRYPNLIYQELFPANVRGVAVVDSFVYLACEQLGVFVLTLGATPRIVYNIDTPSNARGLFFKDDYLYVADGRGGLVIMDGQNRRSPQIVSILDIPGYANKIYVSEDYAYIAAGDGGTVVVNIEDKLKPFIEAKIKTSYAKSVFCEQVFIYIADRDEGLVIVQGPWTVDR